MNVRIGALGGAFGLALAFALGYASPAGADEASDLRAELQAMKQRVESQDRRLREMEGASLTQDEITAAVGQYLGAGSSPARLVGGGEGGSAGFPLGKKPFIKEGPNKLEIAFRNQFRYEAFLYSDDAVGTLSDTDNPVSDAAPRDRSGFEIERLYVGFDGSVLCEELTFKLELNFDADGGTGVEKRYAYLDWRHSGEHHVRAGADRVAYGIEENHSSASLAFVDRSIVSKAFDVGFDNGIGLWGHFGDGDRPKRFLYKVQAVNGEGLISRGSVFNTDAFDTYADNLLFAGLLEWNLSACGRDFKWDEVDHRPCDKRSERLMAVGVSAYYENDDDFKRDQWGGLAVRGKDHAERYGLDAWFRAHYEGWSFLAEFMLRDLEYTSTAAGDPSTSGRQRDMGVHAFVHHRFGNSPWGLGVRGGILWIDGDHDSLTVGPAGDRTTVDFEDAVTEIGAVVNYFLRDHVSKISLDVNWVRDNSGVSSSTAGYLVDPKKGVVVEDGIMIRLQWQLSF